MAAACPSTRECPCTKSELSLFDDVRVQVASEKGHWQTVLPISSLDNQGTISCLIAGTPSQAIDMNNISLYVAFKVINQDGNDLVAAEKVVPCNNLLYSLFRDIQLQLNGQVVTRGMFEYPHKTYIQLLTQNDWAAQGKDLEQSACIGFYPDLPGRADKAYDDAVEPNTGAELRRGWIESSKTCELRGPLMLDLFQQHLYMLPNVDMQLTFHKTDSTFIIQNKTAGANVRYRIKFTDFKLFVRRIQLSDFIVKDIRDQLEVREAIYPFVRREMCTLTVGQGMSSLNQENLFRGQLPVRMFVCMVRNDALNGGSYSLNPFNLQDFGVSEIGMFEDGDSIAMDPMKVNFAENQYLNAYYTLLESIGVIGERGLHTPLTKEAFHKGSTIFCFTRSPDLSIGDVALPNKIGNISLRLNFRQAITNAVSVIIMAEFDSRIQINKNGNISTDYPV